MIHIENGKYIYENQIGVDHINLDIKKGEGVSIMGPNGAGKSTLLKIIVGLFALTEGKYTFNGEDINKAYIKDLKKYQIFTEKSDLYFKTVMYSFLIFRFMRNLPSE